MIDKEYSNFLPEKNSKLENSNQFNSIRPQTFNKKIISNLVSELINHINSNESLNYISNLLFTSLGENKKKFFHESCIESKQSYSNNITNYDIEDSQKILKDSHEDYLAISNDIHLILSNGSELTNAQKLDFCNNQRFFMKLYLKELLIKINKF
ncbi:MAG: hypothetical protein ACFFDH_14775 [Promethearchaeota archaeon]